MAKGSQHQSHSQWKSGVSGEEQSWLYMRTIETISSPTAQTSGAGAVTSDARPLAVPVVLSDFATVLMTQPREQDELKRIQAHFMTLAQCARKGLRSEAERAELAKMIADRMARYGASAEHIAARQVSVLTSRFVVPRPESPHEGIARYGDLRAETGEALDERMSLFEEVACDVFERVYPDIAAQPPDDIVHVSCSGYISPSPLQTFLSRRRWLRTGVTHSYHMGCYGAFPAVRTAVGLVGSSFDSLPRPKRRVDLVHTEFLSLHFDLLGDEPDNFVTSTLFADGFIKYSASPQAEFERTGKRSGLKVLAIDEYILPDSLPEMTLRPGPLQFDMSLSKKVPFMIRDSIADFVSGICEQVSLDFEREKAGMVFAIHPGGPAILNQIASRLGIDESQIALSRKVLREHGNMASATAPHIWQLIVDSPEIPAGTKVLSMAFGPGLTVIGALFEKV
ncbi:MAG TPA: 3-oxoacyl-[acyl-carrier-protein] synthase III C-terminal domain-containing protein [Candidatus Cybelea sp.]|jgi:predicted naringenin-chalcone synthase|nr:3-oxoacyl-[acyl-carrier-protein] synthase III C-terminal domain-containing protein [Candidatus Cybelea sp.]